MPPLWFENFQYIQKAIAREKELKGRRRAKKIALIESMNAAWMDLSRDWYDCELADYRRALDRLNA
jgi:putative endonuclease